MDGVGAWSIATVSPHKRETHGQVKVSVRAVLDRHADRSTFPTIDSQPDIDHLIFRWVIQCNADNRSPEKSGENLKSTDT